MIFRPAGSAGCFPRWPHGRNSDCPTASWTAGGQRRIPRGGPSQHSLGIPGQRRLHRRMGPVGTRIVAETLIGLLDADPNSYRSAYPKWRPTLRNAHGDFGIADLLRVAGVPGTEPH